MLNLSVFCSSVHNRTSTFTLALFYLYTTTGVAAFVLMYAGAVETKQARSDLLTASDNAGVHSSQQQPSALGASVLIAAAELLEQDEQQQNNSTAEDQPAAVTYSATQDESMASGPENIAASSEAGQEEDAVSDRPHVVSLQQGDHAASTPPLSSDSDTEDHVSRSAAAADQHQQQEPTSQVFQDHQHARVGLELYYYDAGFCL